MTSTIKVDTVQDTDGNNIINENANTITIGASGDTITIPAGATITNNGTANNFGRTGAVDWQTGSIKTSTFTAANGEGYFVNSGSGLTMNLPAGSAGAIVGVKDYADNFETYPFTISADGSEKINGITEDINISNSGISVTLVYVDATKGWLLINDGDQSNVPQGYNVEALVVAGGGGGGAIGNGGGNHAKGGGGGGSGGYRTSTQSMESGVALTVTIGDGGTGGVDGSGSPAGEGTSGVASSITGTGYTSISSAGGGKGGTESRVGTDGGSGGGAGGQNDGSGIAYQGGAGDTPSTNPSQGNNGGNGSSATTSAAGGGGGAGQTGQTAVSTTQGGAGGNGTASSISGTSVTRGGGGGGGGGNGSTQGAGGSGGGGTAGDSGTGQAGTANTGGGGGGGGGSGNTHNGGAGGKGVVIISVPDGKYSGTTTGSPTVTTGVSGKTVMVFNSSGSYTT